MEGWLACDLAEGRVPQTWGYITEKRCSFVERTTGSLNLGTLIMKPKRPVTRVSELTEDEASESCPLPSGGRRGRRARRARPGLHRLWSHALGGSQLLAPSRVEGAQAPHALADR